MADKLLPHNLDAELAVLGSILIDSDALVRLAITLKPEDFFLKKNHLVYEAMMALNTKGAPIDILTLSDELERAGKLDDIGGTSFLMQLINDTPSSIHAQYYGNIVEEMSSRRKLIDAHTKAVQRLHDINTPLSDTISKTEDAIFKASPVARSEIKTLQELLDEEVSRQEQIAKDGVAPGIYTGLKDLDKLLGGLQGTDYVIFAGHPGMGKTALAINTIAVDVAKRHHGVGIISLEMSGNQLVQRIIAAESKLSASKIRGGIKDQDDWRVFYEAIKKLNLPIFVDDTPAITAAQLRAKAKRLKLEYNIDLLIIDYMQLVDAGISTESEQAKIAHISRTIKWIARELNIPVIVISNLRKESDRKDKRPRLADLFGSTFLQFDASHIVFVYRDEVHNPDTEFPNIAELIVDKHRHGPTGVVSAFFRKETTTFVDLEVRIAPLY